MTADMKCLSSRNLHDTPCTFLGDPKWKVQPDEEHSIAIIIKL
jgi:hypothetical protein